VLRLRDITPLLPLLPACESALAHIVEDTLAIEDVESDYDASPANATVVLSCCLRALARTGASIWRSEINITAWVPTIVKKWGHRAIVLEALVAVLSSEYADDLFAF
jgi:hypothetical protein